MPRRRAPRGRRRWLVGILALVTAVVVLLAARSRPAEVDVVAPVRRRVVDSLAISGRVHGLREAEVQAPRAGVVRSVFVQEGSVVTAGQALAEVLSEQERLQAEQARAAAAVARSQLEQARRGPLPSERAQARAEARQAIDTARARVAQAREQARLLEAGNRPEAIRQAGAAYRQAAAQEQRALVELNRQRALNAAETPARTEVEQARAAVAVARAQLRAAEAGALEARQDLRRQETLYAQGAAARVDLDHARAAAETNAAQVDQARAELDRAQAGLERQERVYSANRGVDVRLAQSEHEAARQAAENALQRLREVEAGSRPQEVARARAQVAEAEAALRGAERTGPAQVATLEAQPRPEDVAVAAARLQEAERAAAAAEVRLAEGTVRAPFPGIVAGAVVEVGEAVGANQPLLRLVDMSAPEIRVDTDEVNLARLRVGQAAVVAADAFPDRPFPARVTEIGSQVDPLRGTAEVRLRPVPAAGRPLPPLRPLQTVNVNIIFSESEQITVPPGAVVKEGDQHYVLVVTNGRAVRRRVTLGPVTPEGTAILSGLSETDRVVRDSAQVRPGQRVAARRS